MSRIEMCVLRARPAAWIWVLLFAVGVAIPRPLVAQAGSAERASRNLPMGHWAYEPIHRLRSRGYLVNLNPLIQPYRRIDVARGLAALEPDTLAGPVARWVRLLREEFRAEIDRIAGREARGWGLRFTAGGRASTSQRLDVLRPLGDEGIWPRYTAALWAESGPIAIETRLLGDLHFNDEPDGLDPGQQRGGRSDNAYLSVQFPHGAVTVGRLLRNWSALGTRGLMVSAEPAAYSQLGLELKLGRFTLNSFTGELDTIAGHKRYLAAQRVDYTTDRLGLSFGQAILYASVTGGPQLRYLNPVELFFFELDNEPADVFQNLLLDAQVWYQADDFMIRAEGVLDDIIINPGVNPVDPTGPRRAPTRYAFSLGIRLTGLDERVEVSVDYERVSAFAYRTIDAATDRYTFLNRGLGPNFGDYDVLSIRSDIFTPAPGLRLTPGVIVQRQGEGNIREPINVLRGQPAIFLGVTETTYRFELAGRYQPNRHVWITWSVGENFVRDAGHSLGSKRSDFSAVVEARFGLDLPRRISR